MIIVSYVDDSTIFFVHDCTVSYKFFEFDTGLNVIIFPILHLCCSGVGSSCPKALKSHGISAVGD